MLTGPEVEFSDGPLVQVAAPSDATAMSVQLTPARRISVMLPRAIKLVPVRVTRVPPDSGA